MKSIAVALITFYQKFISPKKGFCCAHRQFYGGDSCSEAVKQIILSRGLLGGFRDIGVRFRACADAARRLHAAKLTPMRADIDCGLPGCLGCADVGAMDACFLSSGTAADPAPISQPIYFIPISFGTLVIILVCFFWFYGRQVDFIEIRLLENTQEASDKHLAKLFKNELPDYQIIIDTNDKQVSTNTLKNASAKEWLQLKPKVGIFYSDINQFTIVNKQILKDQTLEEFSAPQNQGSGTYYEYRIKNNWAFF